MTADATVITILVATICTAYVLVGLLPTTGRALTKRGMRRHALTGHGLRPVPSTNRAV